MGLFPNLNTNRYTFNGTSGEGDDFDRGSNSWLIIAPSGATRTLTGLAHGTEGCSVIITNPSSSQDLVIADEDSGSSAANRILCPGGMDITLGENESVMLFYDATAARWRVLGR